MKLRLSGYVVPVAPFQEEPSGRALRAWATPAMCGLLSSAWPLYRMVYPLVIFISPLFSHLTSLSPKIVCLYLWNSRAICVVRPPSYMFLMFHKPMMVVSLGERKVIDILASFRVWPWYVMLPGLEAPSPPQGCIWIFLKSTGKACHPEALLLIFVFMLITITSCVFILITI